MRTIFKGAAIALALTGMTLATTSPASAAGVYFGSGNDRSGHATTAISIGFGDVAFGYRDGYWDNDHRWHRWHNSRDYRNYRGQHGNNYHDWNHNRDRDHGWQRH